MTDCKRNGKRWTISELLNLERDYDLLKLSVQEIAQKHKRSVESILFKLHAEGLTESLYQANGYTSAISKKRSNVVVIEDEKDDNNDSSSDYEEEEDNISEYDEIDDDLSEKDDSVCVECDMDTLTERVWSLETSVGEINSMVKQMFEKMTMEKRQKNPPLRKVEPKL
jgi:hypothetical protein